MGFFSKWKRRNSVQICSDTYALNTQSKLDGIVEAIRSRQPLDAFILVVTHFESTYFAIQDAFEGADLDYQIVTGPVTWDRMQGWLESHQTGQVQLALASLLPQIDPADSQTPLSRSHASRSSSVLIGERHPLSRYDRQVVEFAESLPIRLRLGYFLSLEDAALRPFLGEWTDLVLKQMGLKDHELITSHLVNRRIEWGLRKREQRVKTDHAAASPEEWLEQNDPG